MPKFGEWDVNDPTSADGFTVIFEKARDEKRTGGKTDSPPQDGSKFEHKTMLGKPQPVRCKLFSDCYYQTLTCFHPSPFM